MAIARLSHYMLVYEFALWVSLDADDEWLVGRTACYEMGLMLHIFLLVVIKAPEEWHKAGGDSPTGLGITSTSPNSRSGSQSSAPDGRWWLEDKANERRACLGELRGWLGRL